MSNNSNNLSGKAKKAQKRLNVIDQEIEAINKQLKMAQDTFKAMFAIVRKYIFSKIEGINEEKSEEIWKEIRAKGFMDEDGKITEKFQPEKRIIELNLKSLNNKEYEEQIKKILIAIKEQKKNRSMVVTAPNRIEFECNFLKFYIDFTVEVSEGDDSPNIKGSIIYGTSRTLCFSECILPKESNNCEKCERILRCDRLEDKPLITFSVNRHGMIRSNGELEGEWWVKNENDLLELHYLTLDLIWSKALDWANEIILP